MKKGIISVILILAPTILFGIIGNVTEMVIALFAGFVSAVILNLERFDSFKAGQIEAKMKDVDEVIKDATATMDQLKRMAEPSMNYILADIVRGNHIVGVGGYHKENIYRQVHNNIDMFNLNNDYNKLLLEQAREDIKKTYYVEIELATENEFGYGEMEPFRSYINSKKNYINTDDIRIFLKDNDLYSKNVEDSIQEYERFIKEFY